MLEIFNVKVFGLERAIIASGNPMTVGSIDTLNFETEYVVGNMDEPHVSIETHDYYKARTRAVKLGSSPNGSAHDHFLLGVHVQFDIKYPQYWTVEAERYHNFEIISSQSKMHRLTMMGKDEKFNDMFNKYVDQRIIDIVKTKIDIYNKFKNIKQDKDGFYEFPEDYYGFLIQTKGKKVDKASYDKIMYTIFMECVSNLPMGFEMMMTCDLTYLQLKTIYFQRRNHKLQEDWGNFCNWCENLPMFKELIGIN